jgi:hypothetical protein
VPAYHSNRPEGPGPDPKKTLETVSEFKGKVRVRGSRGTGYGYVSVRIDYTPLDIDVRRDLEDKCKQLLRAAKIDLGRAYTDDTCQHLTDQCSISFNSCRYYRTHRHPDGSLAVIREYGGSWEDEPQASREAA